MQEPNVLFADPIRIESIQILEDDAELVDITVEQNHTFWVSNDAKSWVLTHNSGAPDIDVDVADRDKVLEVLQKECGFNNVIPISNYNLFKVKSLIKDVSKFYGIPFQEVNDATKTVEQEARKATQKAGDDKNLWQLTYEVAVGFYCAKEKETKKPTCDGCSPECTKVVSPSFKGFIDRHPYVGEMITTLFKEQRSLGRHAGGVVLLDDAPNQMPLISSKKGGPQTPWPEGMSMKTLEPLGIVKYDILGLESMRLIERTIDLHLKKVGLYELDVNGVKHRLPGDAFVTLVGNVKKRVDELLPGDDLLSV